MKNWPDFLVVGAARAGTTSLQRYLRQHPGLFLPKLKEPCFFSFAGDTTDYKHGKFAFVIRDQKKYLDLFSPAEKGQVLGEISTPYLYLFDKTISNIKLFHPHPEQLRIVILLRNPADRAFSQYMWRVRDGRETLSFEEAIRDEPKRKKEGYSFDYFYVDRGFYYAQVQAYMAAFRHVKIVLLEDLKDRPTEMLSEVCQFLGVDDHFVFQREGGLNASYEPRWKFVSRLITVESRTKFRLLNQLPDSWRQGIREQFREWNSVRSAPLRLNPETREHLTGVYREDILKLEKLIHRDLSGWLLPG
ncbi:MAG TPA: sulfotransferase [Bacteroidia bacterium]|nr:sulfotransferase [Bacteroidia bacterium]